MTQPPRRPLNDFLSNEEKAAFYLETEILIFIAKTWIDLEGIMLSEISQSGKDKYRMISLTWN